MIKTYRTPLEFILRLNFATQSYLFLPKIKQLDEPALRHVMKEDDEYANGPYHLWEELYWNGKDL
jgi:hypothetical protein